MKKLLFGVMIVVLLVGLWAPTVVMAQGGETLDVLIQANGDTNALVAHIQSLGGTVRFQYRNVPVVAATIPVDQMEALASFPGVTLIEKDGMVYLEDGPDSGKNADNPMSFEVMDMEGIEIEALDPMAIDLDTLPEGYVNFLYTGAPLTWLETLGGLGSIVAVVDTGTVPNVCLNHAVIGAPGYPDGYNATGDGIPATSPLNHWHGTFVGGVIASACALNLPPDSALYQAISAYLPWPPFFVPIIGQAPLAQLYPVKVFPATGEGVPTSVILDGLDHILDLKLSGALDIDIVNMSLGGPTVFDGRDTFDLFIRELKKAKMLVVTSAGNEGPIPNSVGSPATSYDSISVGALDYAISSRILYEYLGLAYWPGTPGQGMVMRPTDETRVANFSSRGPLSDGRAGPDISALGLWNFQAGPNNELMWAGGTSFASPTVAGVAALLNAYWENPYGPEGKETNPLVFRAALLKGANPLEVGPAWQDINDQGWGAVNAFGALQILKTKSWGHVPFVKTGRLKANILPKPKKNQVDCWESGPITLNPSEKFDAVFQISRYTSQVKIDVYNITAPDNSAYAYWPNALEVHVQSAKRTSIRHPIELYWYPFWYGDSFDIVIEDGPWTFWGIPWTYQPMEPGLMKLSLIGDFSNESPVSFEVRVCRENFRQPLRNPYATGAFSGSGDFDFVFYPMPDGVSKATFDLDWHRKWDKFPTSDMDMYIVDSLSNVYYDGVSMNAPERTVIYDPPAGTYLVYIEGYEMYRPDTWKLFVTLE